MEWILLVVAGVAGGFSGSVAGLASVFSYPALLAVGLSAVDANMTNAVALIFISVGSVAGSRAELAGQGPRLRRLAAPALAGGAAGSVLLLVTPSHLFARLVPAMIAAAAGAILLPRGHGPGRDRDVRLLWLAPGVGAIAVYCGYFGAAGGVMALALLLHATALDLARANAMKNALTGLANGVAAAIYVARGHIDWPAAVPLACGLLLGGWCGPALVRRAPPRALRAVIAGAGLALALSLEIRGGR